jgi:hypothetical protein
MYHAAICAALLVVAGVANVAAAEQVTLYNVAAGDHFVDLGQDGGAGNMILWNSDMQDEQGNKLGTGAGTCIRLDAPGNHMCNLTIHHDGHGTIIVSGVQVVEPAASTLTIVGGTGDYQGATGTVRSTPVEDRARFKYEIDYRTD